MKLDKELIEAEVAELEHEEALETAAIDLAQDKIEDEDYLHLFRGKRPPLGELIPLALQHVLAAIVGIVTPAIIVANACGIEDQKPMLIQAAILITAIATLMQLFPIFKKLGAGLPVIMGSSFAYVPTLTSLSNQYFELSKTNPEINAFAVIMGAQIVGGICAIVFAIFLKYLRKLFPRVVTGTVILTIGLSLYPTAVRYIAGGSNAGDQFGSVKNWAVAMLTFAIVVGLNNFGKGIAKLSALLIGMVIGYIVAIPLGLVDFSALSGGITGISDIISIPAIRFWGISHSNAAIVAPQFIPAACVSLAAIYVVNAVQTIGDLSSTTMGGMDRMPTRKELQGGIAAQGAASILGAFIGGLPTASYSQNVGIVTVNRVVNRHVFTAASIILLIAGLFPKVSAALTTIPQCVIGGACLYVFAMIAMTGMQMVTQDGFDMRKKTIVGLSLALGCGATQVDNALAGPGFPDWVQTIFASAPMVLAVILAIILNLILPKTPAQQEAIDKENEEMDL